MPGLEVFVCAQTAQAPVAAALRVGPSCSLWQPRWQPRRQLPAPCKAVQLCPAQILRAACAPLLCNHPPGGDERRKFTFGQFGKTYLAFNTLPLWLPFSSLWRHGGEGLLMSV